MKASVFIGTSLDGFIARADGGLDWLPADGGEPHGHDEFMETVDTIVIGRKTFQIVMGFNAWPYGQKQVIVLSASMAELKAPEGAVCELMTGPPEEIAARLTQRGMKHLQIDGGVTIQGFLKAGLIQRLVITRIPVLLGSGIPLFGSLAQDIDSDTSGLGGIRTGWCRASTWLSNGDRETPQHDARMAECAGCDCSFL